MKIKKVSKRQVNPSKSNYFNFSDTPNESAYYVVFEGTDAYFTRSFPQALEFTFGVYYLMTLEYPTEISQTMETLGRLLLNLHCEQTKGSKKNGLR
jgi:hypothetical protein